jgi:hypothetical protein
MITTNDFAFSRQVRDRQAGNNKERQPWELVGATHVTSSSSDEQTIIA